MPNLCIIPARGGSKRIPHKNIKNFLGKPIIAYSIESAVHSGLFDEIMVSTDDDEIMNIAVKYGASIPFERSAETSNDFATTADVIEEVLVTYEGKERVFEYVCCLYPCAPFVRPANIHAGYKTLTLKNFESVFPVIAFSFPVQRSLQIRNQRLSFFYPEHALSRSQDLEPVYHDAGQYYWLNVAAFTLNKKIITDNCGAVIISEMEAQDIDNETDWKIAELKYRLINDI